MARSIFEEVGTEAKATPAKVSIGGHQGSRAAVRVWLLILWTLVAVMILIGGLTRLTDSGLSIVEWAPITGALPPMSDAAWQAEFDAYRQIPEYQLQNRGMSLSEFKYIYWWEWGHRQLGRLIGLVWAVGFAVLLATKRIPAGWTGRLLLLGALGGLQGAIGWWMVSSGLTGTMLDVASYRLATHLGLAFAILGLIAWYVHRLGRTPAELVEARRRKVVSVTGIASVALGLTFVQILLGALVAGIDAGRTYTDWPLMAGGIVPPDIWYDDLGWRNLFENPGLVQFVHRVGAYILLAVAVLLVLRGRSSGDKSVKAATHGFAALILVQAILGIVTVMTAAPLHWAILHQATAILLWTQAVRTRFLSFHPKPQSVRA